MDRRVRPKRWTTDGLKGCVDQLSIPRYPRSALPKGINTKCSKVMFPVSQAEIRASRKVSWVAKKPKFSLCSSSHREADNPES